jgi:hypothetical protein
MCEDVNGLGMIGQVRGLRRGALQVDQPGERNSPVGTVNRLNLYGPRDIDDLLQFGKAGASAQLGWNYLVITQAAALNHYQQAENRQPSCVCHVRDPCFSTTLKSG